MKKYILFIIFALLQNFIQAQKMTTHEILSQEADYLIEFIDHTSAKLHVKCIYDDSQKDDYYSVFLGDSIKTDASPDFTLNKQLSFDVFADKFSAKCKSKLSNDSAITMITLYKVYQLVWSIKNATADAPEAGILQFSRGALVFNVEDEEKRNTTYIERRNGADSLGSIIINAEAAYKGQQDQLENELKIDLDNLEVKIGQFTPKQSDAEHILNDADFLPFRLSLESLKDTFVFEPNLQKDINELTAFRINDTNKNDFTALFNRVIPEVVRDLKKKKARINEVSIKGSRMINGINDPIYVPFRCDEINSLLMRSNSLKNIKDALLRNSDSISMTFNDKRKKLNPAKFKYAKIDKVELQFERGFIENVKVWITIASSQYIFENIYAIGFSSVNNYRSIAHTKLFVRNGTYDEDGWYIYLSDVFRNYDNRLNNFTRDFSPADTAFIIVPSETHEMVLRKEKYINIIDAKLYVDLKGIDKTKPNGLFQIEMSKRFNINTARLQAGKTRSDFGYFNYLDLFGSLTKIEQNNRELVLKNTNVRDVNNMLISPNYASNLDFARYENYNVGVNLGVLLFDRPDQKFTAYLDFGIKYGHAIIADSVLIPPFTNTSNSLIYPFAKQQEAHTITFQFPKISIELFPESRITPKLSWQLNQTKLFSNNQYKQIVSYEKSDLINFPLERHAGISNQYEVFVKVAPDKNRTSHAFFRWRFFTQFGDANTSFSQIQVGYNYNWTIAR